MANLLHISQEYLALGTLFSRGLLVVGETQTFVANQPSPGQ